MICPDISNLGNTFYSPYFYSFATFASMGAGQAGPNNFAAEIWITFEVIIGFIMLGGLISIFSEKLSRRS